MKRLILLLALLAALMTATIAGAAGTFSYDPPPESGSVAYDAPSVNVPYHVQPADVCINPPATTVQPPDETTASGTVIHYAPVTVNPPQVCKTPPAIDGTVAYDAAAVQVPFTFDPAPRNVTCPDSVCPPQAPPPDTTPPNTSIGSGPANPTQATDASLAFSADEPSTFQCSLDGAAFASCSSPKAYSALAVGAHVFKARAIDTAGNMDASPAEFDWTINAPPPPPPPPPPPAGQANIWVAPAGGSCLRSATPQVFNGVTACGSLDAANDKCQGGDSVLVQGGNYPQSDVTGNGIGRSSTARCTFDAPSGQSPVFGCSGFTNLDGVQLTGASCIDVSGSFLVFRDLASQTYVYQGFTYYGRVDTERSGSYITFDHNHFGAIANGAGNVTISHNELGPSVDPMNDRQADGNNVTWSDNYIHDVKRESSGHIECLTYDAGLNVSFLRNLFKNCDIFDIFNKPVSNTSGLIDHNAFWEPGITGGNNDNVKITSGSGATSCATVVSNNWFGDGATNGSGLFIGCPNASDGGGNTFHDPSVQPPDPRQQ